TKLDATVEALLRKSSVPSVSIAQIRDGKVTTAVAYGMQSSGVPATVETLYDVASLTKPITAQTVLRLVSQGRVSLDEPMNVYWTDPDIAADDRRFLLTPRLALSHQTGFPNWRRQTGGKLTFKFTPGTKYGYSGEGYQYLMRFVQAKLHANFGQLVRTLTFEPDEMTNTGFGPEPWYAGRIASPTRADGSVLKPTFSSAYNAADLVYSTPGDYAKFMIAVLNANGLTRNVADQQHTIQIGTENSCKRDTYGCPQAVGFGLGWEVVRFRDDVILDHDGSDRGYKSFAYLSLTHHTGAVILTNGDGGMDLVVPILEALGASSEYVAYLRASGA
ncbi:MAG: serine hydrolase domain-containing protein, partial [Candidatus Aquilonibacter sp.]